MHAAADPETSAGPRERLARVGVEALSDAELVAILLGTGTRAEPVTMMAARLLAETGGLCGLERLGAGGLADLRGLGEGKASRLLAAIEIGRRLATAPLVRGGRIASSRDVDAAFRARLARERVEHFFAVPLDARNRVLGEVRVALGGVSACPVSPGDVFRALVREAAVGAVLVHNHPSGDPTPSAEDIALTERLVRAGDLLGVRVLDHVIVAAEGAFSFLDAGLLRPSAATRADPV
jgi:DNA repair protein RadC